MVSTGKVMPFTGNRYDQNAVLLSGQAPPLIMLEFVASGDDIPVDPPKVKCNDALSQPFI